MWEKQHVRLMILHENLTVFWALMMIMMMVLLIITVYTFNDLKKAGKKFLRQTILNKTF